MAINPVSASNAAVNSTQAVRPSRETSQPQRVSNTYATGSTEPADATADATNESQPKPTINGSGQTIGTLINITA
jgi:hypothetical protein